MSALRTCVLVGGGLLLLAACGGTEAPSEGPPRYVTTISPFEMILAPIVEGRGTVDALLAPGSSPHTYDPTPSNVRTVANGRALVYGAEQLDGWAADLSTSRRLALLDLVPPTAQRSFEDTETVDPHFWTDPQAVISLLPVLADTLCAIDAEGCSTYQANADSFATALATLDARLRTILQPIRDTPVLLAQPFFRYFLHQYGPPLVGVVEPRPGAEPTPRQLQAMVQVAETSGARGILTQQHLSARAAQAVAESATLPLVPLDPLGGTEGRETYAELMLYNARVLRDSLSRFAP